MRKSGENGKRIFFFVLITIISLSSGLFTYINIEATSVKSNDIQIHDIQGEGHVSPFKDEFVSGVEGIVTYQYKIGGAHYFHMQAPESDYDGNVNTSEGIVVYTGKVEGVAVGDVVSVTGKVNEFHIDGYSDKEKIDLPVTQINARDDQGGDVQVLESDVTLPSPISITSSDIPEDIAAGSHSDDFDPEKYAIDFWESLEGMRVEVAPAKAVAPQEHGELTVVTDEYTTDTINGGLLLTKDTPNAQTISFKLHPSDNARDFAVKTGDELTKPVKGVVNYDFSGYKVYTQMDALTHVFKEGDTESATTTIEKDPDRLTIASYNVENFSANTSASGTPKEKEENIAWALVDKMAEGPDIVGLIEVQDNNGQKEGPTDADASSSYGRLIDAIKVAGGPSYAYANIDPVYNQDGGSPHGNIRVGILYNPDRVSLVDGQEGGSTEAITYQNGELTRNPGRIDPDNPAFQNTRKSLAAQFEFQGKTVVVIANHFNSKLTDEPAFGQHQPPDLVSRNKRSDLACAVNGFVRDIEADNPDENIVVLGDMNDFPYSEPLQTLKGDELVNLIEHVPEEKRYSYIYQGNAQVLDQMLVSYHLAEKADIDILHINSDFTEMHGRASDHDPVLAQVALSDPHEYETGKDDSHDEHVDETKQVWGIMDKATVQELLLLAGALIVVVVIGCVYWRKRRN